MRVEFFKHSADGIFHELFLVDGIHVEVIDGHLGNLELAER